MKIKFKIDLTKSQKEAYDAAHSKDVKYLTLVWSRQSGKSTLMKVLSIEWLLEKNKKIAYVCRNYILAKTLYKDLKQYIPSNLISNSNGSDLVIETITGSVLRFFSAESGASLRGQTFHYLILDEFAFFKFQQTDGTDLWNDILSPTVKVVGKKIIFVSTPLGKNNLFYQMYIRGIDPDFKDYLSLKKTIFDDGLITQDGIESIKRDIPDISFRQEYMCEFLDSSLTFFTGFEKCFTDYDYKASREWIGIDLSAEGKDSTIVTKINERNQVKQYVITGTLDSKYQQIADILNKSKNLQYSYCEVNGIGVVMLNEIKKLMKHKHKLQEWVTTNASKEEICSRLAVQISNRQIQFNNNDRNLYSEFGTFICKYSKNHKLQLGALDGYHDDRIMSLAIALQAKETLQKSFSKDNFAVIDIGMNQFNLQ